MLKFIVVILLTLHSRQPHLNLGDGCPDQASAPPGSARVAACLQVGWLIHRLFRHGDVPRGEAAPPS